MPVSHQFKVEGFAYSLKVLNKAAPDVVKAISKDLQASAQPVVADAKSLLPTPVLSNWGRWITSGKDGRTPGRDLSYVPGKAKRGIKAASNRTPAKGLKSNYGGRRYKVIPLLELRQIDPAGAIYERIGGGDSQHRFVTAVTRKRGRIVTKLGTEQSGRALYPAFFKRQRVIMASVEQAVYRAEAAINKELLK